MAAALAAARSAEPVRYNAVPPEVYRGFGFPGADDLGNMFQFKRDFEHDFCAARDLGVSRSLNPRLQTFDAVAGGEQGPHPARRLRCDVIRPVTRLVTFALAALGAFATAQASAAATRRELPIAVEVGDHLDRHRSFLDRITSEPTESSERDVERVSLRGRPWLDRSRATGR